MGENLIGFAAVVLTCSIPAIAMYTYYAVRKVRADSEVRLAALARGVSVPIEPELSQVARSRRAGILSVFGSLGYMLTFALIARTEPDAWMVAKLGIIPFAIGLGFFLDSTLVKRDLKTN